MKIHRHFKSAILAAGALLLAGSVQLQAQPNIPVGLFNTNAITMQGMPTGGSYQGYNMSVPYGVGTIVWDGITYDAADGSTGAAYITANFESANNTELLVSFGPGYNNWYYENGQNCPGFLTGTADFTQYHAVQFDILYDTNSMITISNFNTGQGWPTSYFTNGLGPDYMNTNSYYTHGVNVSLFTGVNGANVQLGTFQIPTNAGTGWQTVTMPYSDTIGGISSGAGLWFQGSFGSGAGLATNVSASFWIDNVYLLANLVVPPPPTVSIAPAFQGLNLFTGTALNNRESLENTNYNFSWVGASNPVSYSFTISSYPIPAADQVQNHIFLVPNPPGGSAPDYSEPNLIFMDVESTSTGWGASFRYKTNQPNGNSMVYGVGTLATIRITNSTRVGTWSLTFNNNTNVTMSGPGASTNFNIPDDALGSTVNLFSNNVALYYGSQANNAAGENDHTVTTEFKVTGLGAANFDDNFVADAGILNTNIWMVNAAIPPTVRMVGPGNPYYVSWTLPASGFSLDPSPAVSRTNTVWTPTTSNPSLTTGTSQTQLINTNDLPPGPTAYFGLIKRVYSQLLVLLPGETNTPGTLTGKTGTPTPQDTVNSINVVTVLAVDNQFYPVGGIADSISLTSSDGNAILPNPSSMANGSVTFNTFLFQTGGGGTQTVNAMDTTSTNVTATYFSSPVIVN